MFNLRSGLETIKNSNIIIYLLCFIIPMLVFGIVLICFNIYPFGSKSFLIKDMFGQYIEFYNYFYDVLTTSDSLFYSWKASLGMNFFGVYGYYLSSIFSPLIILFERESIPESIVLMTLLKVGSAGLTSSIYLKKVIGINSYGQIIFSVSYALMAYSIVYAQNIMWLDGVVLLPVILLGVEYLIKSNKVLFLSFFLALMFVSNFYISYMVGIFSFMYFWARLIIENKNITLKEIIKKVSLFLGSTVLGICLSFINTLPVVFALVNASSSPTQLLMDVKPLFSILDFMSKFYNGAYDSLLSTGLPNIYIGIFPTLLLPVYFTMKEITKREKITFGILLLVVFLSFEIPIINSAWHGFDSPNMFPFRYSFLFSFLMILISSKVFMEMCSGSRVKSRFLILQAVTMVTILFIFRERTFHMVSIITNLTLIVSLLSLLYLSLIRRKDVVAKFLLILIIVVDLGLNAFVLLSNIESDYKIPSRSEYHDSNYRKVIQKIEDVDPVFYRIETDIPRSFNSPFRLDYKGLRHFSSMTNSNMVDAMNKLGYTTFSQKWTSPIGGTLVTDSILGIKYFIGLDNVEKHGYDKYLQIDTLEVQKNKNYLPIGFMVNDNFKELKMENNNPFKLQNNIINKMLGVRSGQNGVFKSLKPVSISYKNVTLNQQNGEYRLIKKSEKKVGEVSYKFDIRGMKELYALIRPSVFGESKVFVNGKLIDNYPTTYNNNIIDLGGYKEEIVTVDFVFHEPELLIYRDLFYELDIHKLNRQLGMLKDNRLNLTKWSGNTIEGNIDVKKSGELFLSIPYDKGWTVFVNNKKVTPNQVMGAFVSIDLSKGNNHVKMQYTSPGFIWGMLTSIISLIIFFYIFLREKGIHVLFHRKL
ncbi:YfhO family protein [Radiobacillus kanasensis]|uniref:YfhO family protein n=1 Tax=Radiobacillus kanasensis TaxID=2844358 RepID=UPI001E564665|nr:YfhO family protein [Radiobacillus kanasensis]UFT98880.1 YfhO family protein [Radiobacillus kanasensis]